MSDPLAGAEQEVRERPSQPNDFWKPASPEILVGKLDRIDEGKQYGDFAVFLKPVILRAADFKPIAGPDVLKVGLSSKTLDGIFHGADQGSYFKITFVGWSQQAGGRMREFEVVKLDAKRAADVIQTSRATIAQNSANEASDNLPF